MRYLVEKVKRTKDEYRFTHIETKEGLDGKDIEVIKGRNVVVKANLEKTLSDMKEERDNQFEIIENNIKTLEEMLSAIELAK